MARAEMERQRYRQLQQKKPQQQGFTLLELCIVIAMVCILATAGYMRLMPIAVDAERAAFTGVMGWLQAGMNMEMGRAVAANDKASLRRLEQTNPMTLVANVMAPPSNYLGELNPANAQTARPGHWYFDLHQQRLVYHVRYTENLRGTSDITDKRIRFQLKVHFLDADNVSKARVGGLVLVPERSNFWQTPLGRGKQPNTSD